MADALILTSARNCLLLRRHNSLDRPPRVDVVASTVHVVVGRLARDRVICPARMNGDGTSVEVEATSPPIVAKIDNY